MSLKAKAIAALVLLAALAAALWLAHNAVYQAGWDAREAKLQKDNQALQTKQAKVNAQIDTKAVAKEAEIRTVFKDRIIYKERSIPHEQTARIDSRCVVPVRTVELWNSANQRTLPDPARALDESPSDIVLSDIEAQKDTEAELCHSAIEQLILLQDWTRQQATPQEAKP